MIDILSFVAFLDVVGVATLDLFFKEPVS